MKVSNYNFFIPYKNDKVISYNSFTNALGLLDKKDYVKFKNVKGNINTLNEPKLIKDLKRGGFIIEDEIDELEVIRTRVYKSRFNEEMLGLTIAPTANCNFRCVYCFEMNSIRKETMNKDTMDKIIDLVKNKSINLKHLSISWYGGEPLLALDEIGYMWKGNPFLDKFIPNRNISSKYNLCY